MSRALERIAVYLFLGVVTVLTLLPIAYGFFASFKGLDELLANGARLLPQHWDFGAYARVWDATEGGLYFLNSVLVVVGVVVIDTLAASMLGYVLARRLLPGLRGYQAVMSVTLFIGVGTATLYPRFLIAETLGLSNLFGVILVEVSTITVIHSFLAKAFVESLPVELEEAARVDGCGLFRIYRSVVLPLMRPILTTTAVLAFEAGWNNFQVPFVFTLARSDLRTLVVAVYDLRGGGDTGVVEYDLMLAGAMVVIVPVVVVFVVLQRYFVRGLTEGALRG